jgi:glycosyltransferase involved in cell wall biosynthesis
MRRHDVLKILFVCTCLEPGLDGVGDYTRRLASELAARGQDCHLLALADRHVREADASSVPADEHAPALPCLRLPATIPWPERIARARKFCESVAPDWISWQFVLYGFDPRGLGLGLGRRLAEIAAGYRNQIMFHEIWIGVARQSTLKNKIIGRVQKSVIRDLLQRIRPLVVHTHTPLYEHLLGGLGTRVARLPLFGNIPITSRPRPDWWSEKWPGDGVRPVAADRNLWWIFLIFGSIHPEWDGDDFLQRASEAAQRTGKKCALVSIGRPGSAGEGKLRELAHRPENSSWSFLNLGSRPAEEISQWLLAADFGVSPVPPEYLFKSGTAAAMIEHGLPVIATRLGSEYADCPPGILAERLRNVAADFDLASLQKFPAGSLLPEVADRFLADLQGASFPPSAA